MMPISGKALYIQNNMKHTRQSFGATTGHGSFLLPVAKAVIRADFHHPVNEQTAQRVETYPQPHCSLGRMERAWLPQTSDSKLSVHPTTPQLRFSYSCINMIAKEIFSFLKKGNSF